MFALKNLGGLDYFMCFGLFINDKGMSLSQMKYIKDLLERLNLNNLKPCGSQRWCTHPPLAYEGEPMENASLLSSVMWALQYLSHSRPKIDYIVNKLS